MPLKEVVREKYAEAARHATGTGQDADPITSDLYDAEDTATLPAEVVLASVGCGNPIDLAELQAGEIVLDLGCGGGIDVLLSARRVGPAGRAFGLDMTDEMLALANENKRKAGVENVGFFKGEIENLPLADHSVDVIISNGTINLAADKGRVLREAFRVLRPGGRFAVSDILRHGEMPELIARDLERWIACGAGALEIGEYEELLGAAGFEEISIEPTQVYELRLPPKEGEGMFMSGLVRAVKPR